MVYRLIVVLVFGCMLGAYVQAAGVVQGAMLELPTSGASADLMGADQQPGSEKVIQSGSFNAKGEADEKEEVDNRLTTLLNAARFGNKRTMKTSIFSTEEGTLSLHTARHENACFVLVDEAHAATESWLAANKQEMYNPLIMKAAATGHIVAMRILPDDIDVDIADEGGYTPLMIAIKNKKLEIMKFLLEKGANFNRCNKRGRTPLMIAARFGTEEAVLELLKAGASDCVNDKDNEDSTALIEAAASGYKEAVAALLNVGASNCVNDQDNDDQTALMKAAEAGHKEVVEELLAVGARVDMEDNDKETALIKAIKSGKNEIVSLLLKAGADLEGYGYKALYDAVSVVNKYGIGALQALLNTGVRVDVKDRFGDTPLMIAAERGNEPAVKALLDGVGAKASIDMQRENNGETALMKAIRSGNWKCIKALLDAGADISKPNRYGYTPLIVAYIHRENFLSSDKWYLFRYLLRKGVDFTWSDLNGRTFLMNAARSGNVETVQALLEVRVDVNVRDKEGRTALMLAVDAASKHYKEDAKETQETREIVKKLLQADAKIDEQDKDGFTALMFATLGCNHEIVNLLLEFRADSNLQNVEGKTARQLSYERFPHSVVFSLLCRVEGAKKRDGVVAVRRNFESKEFVSGPVVVDLEVLDGAIPEERVPVSALQPQPVAFPAEQREAIPHASFWSSIPIASFGVATLLVAAMVYAFWPEYCKISSESA